MVLWWSVAAAQEMPEKAERYRGMLVKKPENAVLFGRMLDAWLEERDLAGLRAELERRAEEGGAADWRVLAAYHEHAGSEEEALKAYDKALELAPDDAAARLARGKALGAALRFDDALADLTAAGRDPKLALEAGTLRGKLLARAGRPAEAVKAWQELIAAHPEDEGLKEDLVELEIGEGMLEEAVAAARELAEATADPYQKALRRLRVAEVLAQAGKKEEALAEYRGVFGVSAEASWLEREVLARVAGLFTKEDDVSGLGSFLKELREEHPRRIAVKKEAAKSLLAAGEEEEAIAMFREVLKVLPGDLEVREEFVSLLEGAGRAADAAAELEALLSAAGDDGARWERLAGLRRQAGDAAGAKQAEDKAISLLAADEQGMVAKARLLERFERAEEAETILRETVATHGDGGEAGEALAGFLVTRGKTDDALAQWKQIAAKADREGLLRVARSMTAHGKAPDAFGLLKPRIAEFADDPLVLSAFCQAALLSDEAGEAVPHAVRLLSLAETPTDFDTAMRVATGLISREGETRRWIEKLAALPEPTIQERCLLAEIHETTGDSIAAENVLKEAMAGDDALIAAAQRVRLLEMRGAYEAAVAAQRELMELPGGMKTAQVKRLVDLLGRAGDVDGALVATADWLKLAPGDKAAWSKRADLFLDDGRPDEAVAELRRAVAKFGSDEDLRSKLAAAQVEAGMTDEAWRNYFAMYDEGDSAGEKLKWVRELARLAAIEGRDDELVKEFQRRARENSSAPLPLLALAEMYAEWQMADEEIASLADASRRRPEDTKLIFRLVDLHETQGDFEQAATLLRGLTGGAESREARRRLAGLWIRGGDSERGMRELIALEEGGDPRNSEKVVASLAQAGEWETAAGFLGRECAAHPEDWRLAYLRGVCLIEAGREDEAIPLFAALLEADGEIKGLSPLMSQHYYQPYLQPRQAKKPEVSREAVPMMAAYAQRIKAHRNQTSYWQGQPLGSIHLPGTPDEARRIALAQLVDLAAAADDDRRARVEPLLVSTHFDDMDVVKAGAFLRPEDIEELLIAEKGTPDLVRWWFRTGGMHRQRGRASEIVPKAVKLLKDEDPAITLSFLGWSTQGGARPSDPELAPLVLEQFAKVEEKKRGQFLFTVQAVMLDNPDLPKDLRERAAALFEEELAKLEGEPQYSWNVGTLVGKLLRAGRMDEAFEWLNRLGREEEKLRGNAKHVRLWNSRYMHYGSSSPNQSASFPQRLQQAQPSVWQLVGQDGMRRNISDAQLKLLKILGENINIYGLESEPVDVAKAADASGALENRLQRICFLHAAGREDAVKREIEAIGNDPAAAARDLHVAAGFWSAKEPARAYDIIQRARTAPGASDLREEIDTDLMELGLRLVDEEGVDLEPARRAALRKRASYAANPELKTQLAAHLTKLGLSDEAERLVKAPATTSLAMRRTYGVNRMHHSQQDIGAKVGELVRNKRREAAARRVLAELASLRNAQDADYRHSQALETIKSFKLEDEIVKAARPAEGSSFARRRDYATLLISIERGAEALPLLRELAGEMPDDPTVRTALLVALPDEEREEAIASISGGSYDSDLASSLFLPALDSDDPSRRMAAADAIARFLAGLEPDFGSGRNLSWVNYTVLPFVTNDSSGNIRLRPLIPGSNAGRDIDEEASRRRVDICKRLFPAMLRHPQTSDQGFILLHATRDALGTPVEEIDKAAVAAVRLAFRLDPPDENSHAYHYRGRQGLWMLLRRNGSSSRGGGPKGQIPPDAYLAKRAAEGVPLDPFGEDFLAELGNGDAKTAEMVKRCREIVAVPDTKGFDRWFHKARRDLRANSRDLKLLSLMADRAGRQDLAGTVEKAITEAMFDDGADQNALASLLAHQVNRLGTLEARMDALHRLALGILGPEEGWQLYGRLGNSYWGGTHARLNSFRILLQGLGGEPSAELAALLFSVRHRLPMGGYINSTGLKRALGDMSTKEDVQALGVFSLGPEMVAGMENSEVFALTVLQALRNGDSEKRAKLLLEIDGGERFWARVIGGIMQRDQKLVRAELDRHAGVISSWPAESRAELARFLETNGVTATPGSKVATMFAESRRKDLAQIRKEAAELLEKGAPENLHPYSPDPIFPMISALVEADPDLAVRVWNRCLEDFGKRQNSGSSSSGGFSTHMNDYATGELIERMCRANIRPVHLAGFIARFARGEQGKLATHGGSGNNSYYMRQLIESEMKLRKDELIEASTLKEGPENHRTMSALWEAVLNECDAEAKAALPAMFVLHLSNGWYSNSEKDTDRLLGWLEKTLRPKDARLADSLTLAILSSGGNASRKDGLIGKAGAAALTDARVPVLLRMESACALNDRGSGFSACIADPDGARAMAGLFLEYISSGRRWASSGTVRLLHKLAVADGLSAGQARELMERVAEFPPVNVAVSGEAANAVASARLALAVRGGDPQVIARESRAAGTRGRLDLALHLWDASLPREAASLLARPGEYHSGLALLLGEGRNDMIRFPEFSKKLEASLPNWLASIENPEQRFRVECLVSSLRDAKDDDAPETSRPQRMADLAARFDAEAGRTKVARLEMLAALSCEHDAAVALEDAIAKETRGRGMEDIVLAEIARQRSSGNAGDNESEQAAVEVLIRRRCMLALARGDASPSAGEVTAIANHMVGDNRWIARTVMSRILKDVTPRLIRSFAESDPERVKPLATETLRISTALLGQNESDPHGSAVALAILSQAAAGDGAGYRRWVDDLDPKTRNTLDAVRKRMNTAQIFRELNVGAIREPEYEETRRKILLMLFSDPETMKREVPHPTFLSELLDRDAFSREDIFAMVDALPAGHVWKARLLTEKAGMIGWRVRDQEAALKTYAEAEEIAGTSGDPRDLAYVRAYKAGYMNQHTDRKQEALEIAASIDPELLDERERGWRDGVLKAHNK